MSDQTPEQIEKSFSDLDHTQGIRRRILDKIADKAIENEDPEMIELTLKTSADMDKVSLGRLKINEKSKANETKQNEAEALAKYLVTLSDRRTSDGRPEPQWSDVPNQALPANRRPKYDDSVRDASSGSENTAEFTARIEAETKTS